MRRAILTLTILASYWSCATAEDNATGPKLNTFEIWGGAQVVQSFDSTLRLDFKPLGVGTEIDFEEDLGFDGEGQVGRVDAQWRINRKHGIRFSHFDIERTSGLTTDEDYQWGDLTIPAGTGITAFFNTSVTKLNYRYTFAFDDNWEAGLSAGLHTMRLGTGIGLTFAPRSEEYKGNLPLPVFGLWGTWQFHDRWRLTGFSEALYVAIPDLGETDELEGYLIDSALQLEFDVCPNFGVGLGANWFLMDVEAEQRFLRLGVDYSYLAGLLYARLYF